MPLNSLQWDGAQWDPFLFNIGVSVPGVITRDNLVPGSFFPDATNTGHITPAAQLTTVSGLQNWGAERDGQTITKVRFTDRVTLDTQNITFKDCLFEGYLANNSTGGSFTVRVTGSRCVNVRFIDCTFRPKVPDHGTHVIIGHHWTATRCQFANGVDSVSAVAYPTPTSRLDVRIEGSWLHDLAYFSPDSFHPGATDNQTHNDNIQWGGGAGLSVVGCRIEGFANPAIGNALEASVDTSTNHVSGNHEYPELWVGNNLIPVYADPQNKSYMPLGELTFTDNWCAGGAIGLNMAAAYGAFPSFTTGDALIARNRFGWHWKTDQNYVINKNANQNFTVRDNVRWGGPTPWFHGNALTGLTGNEDNPDVADPWDVSTPFNTVRG